MFKEVEINNFQSHRKTRLNLSEGINLFTGNSDCGKSAIMRAILWTITNRPSGDSFVSNAIKDSKGKVKGETSVTIDGVARVKSKDFNGYDVEGIKYEALRTDVPADISDKLNIKDVNIQRQLDGPFMLSNTPGENAKYINSLVNLEVIDDANYWVSSKSRDAKTELKYLSESIDDLEKKLYDEEKIQKLQEICDNLSALRSREQDLLCQIDRVFSEICEFENLVNSMPDENKVHSLYNWIGYLEDSNSKSVNVYREISNLQDSIIKVNEYTWKLPSKTAVESLENKLGYIYTSLDKQSNLSAIAIDLIRQISVIDRIKLPDLDKVSRLNSIAANIGGMEESIYVLTNDIGGIARSSASVNSNNSKIMHLQPLLDDAQEELKAMACPLCGRRDCSDSYRNWIDR